MSDPSPILLTGATGYVGGRLLRSLRRDGHRVRCLARRPEYLDAKTKADDKVEVVQGDVLDRSSLDQALQGVEVAYYLIHSMGREDFEEFDRIAAENFAAAAREQGVRRVIYLGGLGSDEEDLSPHLRSRHEVGEILRTAVPVIEFRASVVLGSGSLSFEMLRALVERLPVMVTPRWVDVLAQPIAITDLLAYLTAAIDLNLQGEESRIFEVGGSDQVSYGDMMREYASQRGLHRLMIPVPVLTPRLSSLWLGLVTPLYARVGRKLIESICHPTVVSDPSADEFFEIRPRSYHRALEEALRNEDQEIVMTRWSDALSSSGDPSWGGERVGGRLVDSRCTEVEASPAAAFAAVRRIGGRAGWYYADWLWRLRGFIDLLVGGVGLRRGRRDPENLAVGDTVDWWRVEEIRPGEYLRLAAEMKVPGRAWLEFRIRHENKKTTIRQTAIFDSSGLFGLLYWYGIYPIHSLVFRGMLKGIAERAATEMKA